MLKRLHENVVNVIAVSPCNQIYQHVLASWFMKARHQQQKEADYYNYFSKFFKNSFSKSSKGFWYVCKKLLEKTSYPESLVRRCSLKNIFLKISQIFQGNTCVAISFLHTCNNRPAILQKKRIRHSCFLLNFAKCLRTPSLQNTSGRLLLSIAIICQDDLKLIM